MRTSLTLPALRSFSSTLVVALPLIAYVLLAPSCSSAQSTTYDINPTSFSLAPNFGASFGLTQLRGDYLLTGAIATDGTLGGLPPESAVVTLEVSGPNGFDLTYRFQSHFDGAIATQGHLYATPESRFGDAFSVNNLQILDFDIASPCFSCTYQFSISASRDGGSLPALTPGLSVLFVDDNTFDSTSVFVPVPTNSARGIDFATNNDLLAGDTPELPILPADPPRNPPLCNCIQWDFFDVPTDTWVDPPLADSFTYTMAEGSESLFTDILDFPPGFDSTFSVEANGLTLGVFGPGDRVDFVDLLGDGV